MKQEQIIDAFGHLSDDLLEEAENARAKPVPVRKNKLRFLVRILVAAALAVSMALGVLAAYQRWHMPNQLNGFEGDGIDPYEVNIYPITTESTMATESESVPLQTDAQERPDEWYISRAQEILRLVHRDEPDVTKIEVNRQKNLWWSRDEIEVFWKQENQSGPSVRFDAQTGYLIGVTSFSNSNLDSPMLSDEEVLSIAENYYESLPYAQGYTFRHVEKICDTAWMYYFDRPITVEVGNEILSLQSDYEQVRITINPSTGAFELSNCFYVPLLDDHEPGELPLTKEQAMEIANQSNYLSAPADSYQLKSKIGICLPRLYGVATNAENLNYPYADVTRLAWILTFRKSFNADKMFMEETEICVDLYTGEILSMDTTR